MTQSCKPSYPGWPTKPLWPGFSQNMFCYGTADPRISKKITIFWNITWDSKTAEFSKLLLFFVFLSSLGILVHYFIIFLLASSSYYQHWVFPDSAEHLWCTWQEGVGFKGNPLLVLDTMDMGGKLLPISLHTPLCFVHACSHKHYLTSLPTDKPELFSFSSALPL